jgi:AGCS family alanine or glycine:cation symporter
VYLFGVRSLLAYRLMFLAFTWAGTVITAQAVLDFGDLMILGMAFPNLIGVVLLSGKVKTMLDDYLARLRAGAFEIAGAPGPVVLEPAPQHAEP